MGRLLRLSSREVIIYSNIIFTTIMSMFPLYLYSIISFVMIVYICVSSLSLYIGFYKLDYEYWYVKQWITCDLVVSSWLIYYLISLI